MKLNKENEKELIVSLIKEDLKNISLINGLDELGLYSDAYRLQLNRIFFALMGFKDNEKYENLYDQYFDMSMEVSKIKVHIHPKKLDKMAHKIYKWLNNEKKKCKKKAISKVLTIHDMKEFV